MHTPQKGASVLAALLLVGVVGTIGFVVKATSHPATPVSQTAATAAPTVSITVCKDANENASKPDQCNPGEVHTVDMTKGRAQCVREVGTKCYVLKEGKYVKNPDTSISGSEACKTMTDQTATSCFVRYCPPPDVANFLSPNTNRSSGTCTVIECVPGQTESDCVGKNFSLAESAGTKSGYDAFVKSFTAQAQEGTASVISSPLYKDAGKAIYDQVYGEVQSDITKINTEIDRISKIESECGPAPGPCRVTVEEELAKKAGITCQMEDGKCYVTTTDALDKLDNKNLQLTKQMEALKQIDPATLKPEYDSNGVPCISPYSSCPKSGAPLPAPRPCPAGSTGSPGNCGSQPPPGVAPPPGPVPDYNNQTGFNTSGSSLGNLGTFAQLGRMLGQLLTGNTTPTIACAKTQDQYYQQQQQYNQQIQQYQYQYQQYQYQQQQSQYYYGGQSSAIAPPVQPVQPPQPCYNNQNPQQCINSPQQPQVSNCTSGTWKPTNNGTGCISGWQCVPNSTMTGTEGGTPVAELKCEPKVADVGMSLAISFGCQNSVTSVGSGFETGGQVSGSATTTVQSPPGNSNTATYSLTCTKDGVTAGAQCSVQIARPSIVLVVNPKRVKRNEAATVGWITSGITSCTVSSPQLPEFTLDNSTNTSANGVATTPSLTSNVTIVLECTTMGGATKEARTTIEIES